MSKSQRVNIPDWQDMCPLVGLYTESYDNPFKCVLPNNGVSTQFSAIKLNYDSTFRQPSGPVYLQRGIDAGCDRMMINIRQQSRRFEQQDQRSKFPQKPNLFCEQSEMILSVGKSVRPVIQMLFCFRLIGGKWIHVPQVLFDTDEECNPDNFVKVSHEGKIYIVANEYGDWY